MLFNIVGGEDLSMNEVDEAAKMITKSVDPAAQIIFGAAIDPDMKDQMKITLVATRFDQTTANKKIGSLEVNSTGPSLTDNEDELEIPAFLRRRGK